MKTCCFIGHRNTKKTPELLDELRNALIRLIEEKCVKTFLFGSKSKFDDVCFEMVTELKFEYPDIKLVHVRSQYLYLTEYYKDYLLESYDDTYIPEKVENAGKASYVERNQAMINSSDLCVFYNDDKYNPPERKQYKRAFSYSQPKSGTRIAYEHAIKKNKEIINLFNLETKKD